MDLLFEIIENFENEALIGMVSVVVLVIGFYFLPKSQVEFEGNFQIKNSWVKIKWKYDGTNGKSEEKS